MRKWQLGRWESRRLPNCVSSCPSFLYNSVAPGTLSGGSPGEEAGSANCMAPGQHGGVHSTGGELLGASVCQPRVGFHQKQVKRALCSQALALLLGLKSHRHRTTARPWQPCLPSYKPSIHLEPSIRLLVRCLGEAGVLGWEGEGRWWCGGGRCLNGFQGMSR